MDLVLGKPRDEVLRVRYAGTICLALLVCFSIPKKGFLDFVKPYRPVFFFFDLVLSHEIHVAFEPDSKAYRSSQLILRDLILIEWTFAIQCIPTLTKANGNI